MTLLKSAVLARELWLKRHRKGKQTLEEHIIGRRWKNLLKEVEFIAFCCAVFSVRKATNKSILGSSSSLNNKEKPWLLKMLV